MKQEERRARTLNALHLAAHTAFARSGYADATLDRIASDAGVSKGAVYAYYPTKLDLFLAVTDQVLDDARQRVSRVASHVAKGETPQRAAPRYLGAPDDDQHVSLMTEIWRMAAAEDAVRQRLDEFRRERVAVLGTAAVDRGDTPRQAAAQAEMVAKLIDAETLDRRLRLGVRSAG